MLQTTLLNSLLSVNGRWQLAPFIAELTAAKSHRMNQIHQCKKMESAEAWIKKSNDEWILKINRVATEQDLEENHYLEEVGQTIEHIAMNVLFCPYCGEKLNHSTPGFIPSFDHSDFSRW